MNIGHLGTADALIDPAHHIAQDALHVIVHLCLHHGTVPVGPLGQWQGQQLIQCGAGTGGGQRALTGEHVGRVIMGRMQHRRRRTGHPGTGRPRLGVGGLFRQHGRHQIRGRPHALADLRPPLQPAGQTDIDVAVLIGLDPDRRLHLGFRHHRPGFHRGVNFIAGPVEKAGVDKGKPVAGNADTFFQVGRGPPLFIHDPQFDGVARQAQNRFDPVEQLTGKGHLIWPMHLWLDHIDRAAGGIARAAGRIQIMDRAQRGDDGIHQPLWHLCAIGIQNGGVGHQMADIAHQHQGAGLDRQGAGWRVIDQIGVQAAGGGPALLGYGFRQAALHQPQPVAISQYLVGPIDGGHRILTIHDDRQRRFQPDIGNARRVGLANRGRGINPNLDQQAVVAQQYLPWGRRVLPPARQLRGISKGGQPSSSAGLHRAVGNGQPGHLGPPRGPKRHRTVKEVPGPTHHPRAPRRIKPTAHRQVAQRIGAIQRVIQRPPAGIGGVQRVARIHHRNHQLRPGDLRHFGIDIGGFNREIGAFGHQIADIGQKITVTRAIPDLFAAAKVPAVNLSLQRLAPIQQGAVPRAKITDQRGKPGPECGRRHPGPRQGAAFHKRGQRRVDRQPSPVLSFHMATSSADGTSLGSITGADNHGSTGTALWRQPGDRLVQIGAAVAENTPTAAQKRNFIQINGDDQHLCAVATCLCHQLPGVIGDKAGAIKRHLSPLGHFAANPV